MNSKRSRAVLTTAVLVGLAGLFAFLLFLVLSPSSVGQRIAEGREKVLRSRVIREKRATDRPWRGDRRAERKIRLSSQDKVREKERAKPEISLAEAEEEILSAAMAAVFRDLQAALDNERKEKVFALVHKLQAMDEWPDGIPKSVKMKALEALAWFGSDGVSEAIGFLADSDPEVVQTTIEKFEEMLMDSSELGDRGVSEIIKQLAKVVHDRDALDTFFMEMNGMRDTVKAETALAIYDSENADAIAVLNENTSFLFNEIDKEEISRKDVESFRKDAEEALKKDPARAAEEEEFYGPVRD